LRKEARMSEDLSDAYAIAAHTPDWESFPPRWTALSQAYRAQMADRSQLGLRYGPGARNWFDLYLPEGPSKGVVVFVHGGYWRAFDPHAWSYLAEGPRQQGWAVAQPAYTLCPEARIGQITQEITAAICAIAERIAGPIRLTGHSAGGHLVARMADPTLLPTAVAARIAHILPISPLGDLRPLLQTNMNPILQLDAAEARSESPIFQPKPAMHVTLWVGAEERPVFVDQAKALSQSWACDLVIEPNRHHFDLIDALAEPNTPMTRTLLGS
jgi:acetyl esterase/lipase